MKFKRMFAFLLLAMGLIVANAAVAVGAEGPTGKKGPRGDKGPRGNQGIVGKTGATGRIGSPGPRGGAVGAAGPPGTPGAVGPPGAASTVAGPPGAVGAAGTPGTPGVAGPTGADGAPGTPGAAGGDITTAIATEATNRTTAIAAETARATGVEGTLNTAIATETARALAAEATASSAAPVHRVGDSYQGGTIFWVEPDGQHGLIAAKTDQAYGVLWLDSNYPYFAVTGAAGNGLYAGRANTILIVSQQNTLITVNALSSIVNSAAQVAVAYSRLADGTGCTFGSTQTCYSDWYLPSLYELQLLNRVTPGASTITNMNYQYYWSSTESEQIPTTNAYVADFLSGGPSDHSKASVSVATRVIRAF